MKSFADLIVSWSPAEGQSAELLAGLSAKNWLASDAVAAVRERAVARLADRLEEPDRLGDRIGRNTIELLDRLRDAEAVRGADEAEPTPLRLAFLGASAGGAVRPPVPIWWLAIDACPGRRQLPNALLQQIWQSIAGVLIEGDDPRPYARSVLIVSVTGPQRARPDLVVVGPAQVGDATSRDVACIRAFHFSRMQTQSEKYVRSQAESLEAGLSHDGIGSFFLARRAGDTREVVRNELRDQLSALMVLLEDLPGGVKAETPHALRSLREAATVVVFRMMFLGEIESRGLLWRPGSRRRQLVDAASAALDRDIAADEDRAEADIVSVFLSLCRALRGGVDDADVEVVGGSLFNTRPNDRFDDAVVAILGALDVPELVLEPAARARWREVLAETFQITQGVVIDRSAGVGDGGRDGLGYLGLGGTEHVHRILGDVYEQILALEPKRVGDRIQLSAGEGRSERSSLGAHYTPESLVEELVRPALGALFVHHWSDCGQDPARYAARVAALRVLDPAMGSAHFLTVAAREIATELEWVARFQRPRHEEDPDAHEPLRQRDPLLGRSKTAEELPIKEGLVRRLRDVVQRCCHGVDVSPIAVELGKLSLWLFTMTAQKQRLATEQLERPELAFLDANIQCGDSLVGVFWRDVGPIISERFGAELKRAGLAPQLGLFRPGGTLVADRIDEVSALLASLHGDDASLRALAATGPVWLGDADPTSPYAVRQAAHRHVQRRLADLRWVYDLATLAVFFDVRRVGKRLRVERLERELAPGFETGFDAAEIDWQRVVSEPLETTDATVRAVRAAVVRLAIRGELVNGRPLRALHWGLAFPDVFASDGDGFDLIVANPPFIGDRNLGGSLGDSITGHLVRTYTDEWGGGTIDLASFFALHFDQLLDGSRGVAAFLAPNTIAQAKNRTIALSPLVNRPRRVSGVRPFDIFRALRSRSWPGDAAVHVCLIWLSRTDFTRERVLVLPSDGGLWCACRVNRISTFLDDSADQVGPGLEPYVLPGARTGCFSNGMFLRGANGEQHDFVKPQSSAQAFMREAVERGEGAAVYAYLTNDLVQNRRQPFAEAVCVDFFDVLESAELINCDPGEQLAWLRSNYPFCLASIDSVRIARGSLPDNRNNHEHRTRWWLFGRPRVELRRQWKGESHVLVAGSAATKIWSLTNIPRIDPHLGVPICPSNLLNVLPASATTFFAVLQSALGELHVRRNSSTLKSDLRFSPEYALIGFPFPWATPWSDAHGAPYPLPAPPAAQQLLNPSADALTEVRNRLLADPETLLPEVHPVPKDWGPTELYNRYDDSGFDAPGIEPLRDAHVALLDAVLGAYAADATLPEAGPMFAALRSEMAAEPDRGWAFERPWIDGTERFVPKAAHRRRIIEALLQANLERWTQEIGLIAERVAMCARQDAALGLRLAKGVDAAGLVKALDKHPVQVHRDDAAAVLAAGARGGEWVEVVGEKGSIARWLGGLSPAERREALAQAARAQKALESQRERAEQDRKPSGAKSSPPADAPPKRSTRRPALRVAPKPVTYLNDPEPGLELLAARRPIDPAVDAVSERLDRTSAPIPLARLLADAGIAPDGEAAIREHLGRSGAYVELDAGFIRWSALLDHVEVVLKAAPKGLRKAEVFAALAERGVGIGDDVWMTALQALNQQGRVTRSGRARGTRYHA